MGIRRCRDYAEMSVNVNSEIIFQYIYTIPMRYFVNIVLKLEATINVMLTLAMPRCSAKGILEFYTHHFYSLLKVFNT